ncbi:elongation factor 3 [Rhodovibrio sodomensis]|uniref:ATP-binding protein Uup n=1 Tax=Rhodovibrio sodomensis TaxID=1088 RepID=A0ABS1DF04_9PROT|nr:ATP-binding cassette domain-containing protein [Rhodovibrio sodomensis]MBK1668512.1 elongation factor 3 [Rhodovibrio sodomensis]
MASNPPLVQFKDVRLALGHEVLAEHVDATLARGDRACLVGRNGSGKSTLLRALAGEVEVDRGELFIQPGAKTAYLPQQPDLPPEQTVHAYVTGGLPGDVAHEEHRVDQVLARLDLEAGRRLGTLSGGEGRRAALARTLVSEPDVLLLDEPTNHLDLPTIEWLEGELKRFRGTLILVSHDRAFLRAVSNCTLWLDRGTLRTTDRGFERFDQWAEEVRQAEAEQLYQLNKKIAREAHWEHGGISGRRKRNQRRLAELQELRQTRAEMLKAKPGEMSLQVAEAERSGKTVIEAERLSKGFEREDGQRVEVVRDFSTRIRKGDRIGVIGPNGAGKTTLIKMLTGDLNPDSGQVRHGTNLQPIYFDQRRESLDPEKTLWQTLAPGGGDTIDVGGKARHVVAYLKDFLFEEGQARQPVKALSGGETNRLLLARLFARRSNLIVMDEPTNDLDVETLDLLVEVLGDYDGTLLLVSHDRDFLDKTVTSIVAMEGDGRVEEFPGGYTDALSQRRGPKGGARMGDKAKADKKAGGQKAGSQRRGDQKAPGKRGSGGTQGKLSYKEQRELDELPAKIEKLQQGIDELQAKLAEPDFFTRDPDGYQQATEELQRAQRALDKAETRWLELEERREALAQGTGS